MGTWCPDTQPSTPCHKDLASEQLAITMDINSKSEFIYFMQRACEDQSNDCYIELYNILLRAFVCADCDFDGQVSEDEFGGMINAAAALPKKFGFDWWQGSPSDQSRRLTRTGTAPFPLTSGSASPTRTTRAKLCQLPLTRPTRTPSLPTAKRWETLPLRATRRSTGSAGSASRLRTPPAMARCLATSLRR